MWIVTLALAAGIGLITAPVLGQASDPAAAASPSLPSLPSPPEVVPAPAQQVPPQDMPAQQPQKQTPPASQPQQAQEQAPPAPAPQARPAVPSPSPASPRRYSFNRVDNGFVRFDNATGQVAFCSPHTVGWACQTVSEDHAALDQDIARLKDEVAALKEEIAKLRAPPPAPPAAPPAPPPAAAAPPPADEGDEIRLKLPSHEDLARAEAYLAETWRRLVEMIDRFQRNLRDGGHDAAEDTNI